MTNGGIGRKTDCACLSFWLAYVLSNRGLLSTGTAQKGNDGRGGPRGDAKRSIRRAVGENGGTCSDHGAAQVCT